MEETTMSTVAIDTAATSNNTEATAESSQRMQIVESEQDHDECNGCNARKALEDAVDSCLEAGFDRDVISEVVEGKIWASVDFELFLGVDACVEDDWPLADILEAVEGHHAYMMERRGKEPQVIPVGDAISLRDAA
jgi:hypothetical protein